MAREKDEKARPTPYRRFLYLDADEVMNSLSSVQGGEVVEATERVLRTANGSIGASVAFGGAKLEIGGKKGKEVERQVKVRQTIHFAMSALLDALDENGQLRHLKDDLKADSLKENMLIEFEADMHLCRSRFIKSVAEERDQAEPTKPWWRRFLASRRDEDAHRARLEGLGEEIVVIADVAHAGWQPLVLALKRKYVLVPSRDVCRRATVVGQVDGKPLVGEWIMIEPDSESTRVSVKRQLGVDAPEIRLVGTGGGLAPTEDQRTAGLERQTIEVSKFDGWLADVETQAPSVSRAMGIRSLAVRPLCIYK